MNFGNNLYQWFLSNAQSLVLMAIVHHGALVISHTTADHPAVPDLHLEGVLAPA